MEATEPRGGLWGPHGGEALVVGLEDVGVRRVKKTRKSILGKEEHMQRPGSV